MAKKSRKKRTSRPKAKWHLGGPKANLARKRGHKPLALLKLYHSKMERNLGKLESVIRRREAIGE
jgi:hypothetical protein